MTAEKLSETCCGCLAFLPTMKKHHIDSCKYNMGSVPRINCELGEILKHEKTLDVENQKLDKLNLEYMKQAIQLAKEIFDLKAEVKRLEYENYITEQIFWSSISEADEMKSRLAKAQEASKYSNYPIANNLYGHPFEYWIKLENNIKKLIIKLRTPLTRQEIRLTGGLNIKPQDIRNHCADELEEALK